MTEIFDQPYNPDAPARTPETLPLDEILRRAIDAAMTELHTWLPAKVILVRSSGTVDIQPQLKRRYTDGTLVDLPVIQNARLWSYRGAGWGVRAPVAAGDTGIALFCERSIDIWSVSGGSVDPEDSRKHDLSDAVFLPGLYPVSQELEASTDLILENGTGQLAVQKTGKFKLASGTDELLSLLSDVLQACSLISNGAGPTANAAVFSALKVRLDLMKGI